MTNPERYRLAHYEDEGVCDMHEYDDGEWVKWTDYEVLRGNLTLAEEGLANYALEVDRLQMRLKRHEPVSLYDGHDIDWWKAEAERLKATVLRVKQARLDWAMVCKCTCAACETFSNAIRLIGRGAVEPTSHEPDEQSLGLGDLVTYAPRYPSKLPREGWMVECLPPEQVYVIKHPEGSVIAVAAGEIQPVQKSGADLCAVCEGMFIDHRHGALGHDWQPKPSRTFE